MEDERAREYEEALNKLKELRVGDLTKMWIEYDKQNDILYLIFGDEEPDESIMLEDDIVLSLKGDKLVGISIYNFSRRANI
ncbi:MAG: DUF2283 domain-containing protein [Desulfurococcales archaeon]|nr:DUF2283 domain-containing protein [Desulfurococcales archaeon]MCE4622147.1 DUF2283 domain-containing protein [Desulfurococcales archaeon]MCE4627299.1 DUF2283 domain-containing protein [Desulfurococcales archaeon]